MNLCDSNAVCVDTVGSFVCICNDGYTSNGTDCIGEFNYYLDGMKYDFINLLYL